MLMTPQKQVANAVLQVSISSASTVVQCDLIHNQWAQIALNCMWIGKKRAVSSCAILSVNRPSKRGKFSRLHYTQIQFFHFFFNHVKKKNSKCATPPHITRLGKWCTSCASWDIHVTYPWVVEPSGTSSKGPLESLLMTSHRKMAVQDLSGGRREKHLSSGSDRYVSILKIQ